MVEESKVFEDFITEVTEGAFSSYHISFRECGDLMKELYPKVDISCIVPKVGEPWTKKARRMRLLHPKW